MLNFTSIIPRRLLFSSGSLAFTACQFVLALLIARYGGVSSLGGYSLVLAALNPLFFFARLNMKRAIAGDVDELYSFYDYKDINLIATFVIGGVAVVLGFFYEGVYEIGAPLLVAKIIESYSVVDHGVFLQKSRSFLIGISLGMRGLGSVFFCVLLYLFFSDVTIAIWGVPISWAAVAMLFDKSWRRKLVSNRVRGKGGKVKLFCLLLPLGVSGFLGQFQQGFPRMVIAGGASTELLGFVAPVLQIHAVVVMLGQTIYQPMIPKVAKLIAARKKKGLYQLFQNTGFVICVWGGFVFLLCQFFGDTFIRLLFGGGYELSGQMMGLASISWALRLLSDLFQVNLISRKKFRFTMLIQVSVTIFSFLCVSVCWGLYGVTGIFCALIATNTLAFFINFFSFFRLLKYGFNSNS